MNGTGSSGAISQRFALECQVAGVRKDGGYVELRYWPSGRGVVRSQWFEMPCEFDRLADRVSELAPDADVYVGALGRSRHGGRSTADCLPSHWLWADCDGPQSVAAALELSPNIVVETSPDHALAMWTLREPLAVDRVKRENKRLALHLGADANCCDPARIIRVAGTRNHKYDPAPPVVCTRLEPLPSYTVSELVCHLPDPEPTRQNAVGVIGRGAIDHLKLIPPSEYVEALTGRTVGRDGKACCPFHSDGRERTASLHAYDDPDKGWYCFGCLRGGDIYNFAAELYGIDGRTHFPAVRERLIAGLLGCCRA